MTSRQRRRVRDQQKSKHVPFMAAVLAGITQNRILTRNAGKAPEVGDICELGAAGRHALVTARPRDEAVACCNGAHWRFQKGQAGDAPIQIMRQHLGDPPRIRTAGPCECAGGEPSRAKPGEARSHERAVPQQVGDQPCALVDRVFQINPAARITQMRIATGLKRSPHGLAENMREAAHFGDKRHAPAPDLSHSTPTQKHALAGIGPVHPP